MNPEQTTFENISTLSILEPGHQLRDTIDAERLGELADSMAAEGLHQPIGLRGPLTNGHYEIIWGHRRYLAARLLRWDRITARVFDSSFDPLVAACTENLQRVDLNPVEEAKAVHKLIAQNRPIPEIARLFRRSITWVHQRLEILTLHPDLIDAIQRDALKLNVALALQDIDHEGYRLSLISEAIRTGATGPTAQIWRQHYLSDRDRIIGNHMVVEEVIAARDAWVIYVNCQACRTPVDYRDTEAWRFCTHCSNDLRATMNAEAMNTTPLPSESLPIVPSLQPA